MKQLLKVTVRFMSRGIVFALSNLLSSFILGLLFMIGIEYVVVNYLLHWFMGLNEIGFSLFYILLVAVFISHIFSKRNLTNFLFVSGYSRKNINTIKMVASFILNLMAMSLVVASIFVLNNIDFSIFTDFSFLIYLLKMISMFMLFSELAIYLNILYRKLSIKKAKGVNKKVYSYIYTIILIVLVYCFRFVDMKYIQREVFVGVDIFRMTFSGICLLVFFILHFMNRKNILTLDIK